MSSLLKQQFKNTVSKPVSLWTVNFSYTLKYFSKVCHVATNLSKACLCNVKRGRKEGEKERDREKKMLGSHKANPIFA